METLSAQKFFGSGSGSNFTVISQKALSEKDVVYLLQSNDSNNYFVFVDAKHEVDWGFIISWSGKSLRVENIELEQIAPTEQKHYATNELLRVVIR